MPRLLTLAIVLALVAPAVALDPGNRAPEKPAANHPPNVPSDDVVRQGGDTMLDAVVIGIPYDDTGTTVGYNDDYDEVCPYTFSSSPDVVYSTTPTEDVSVDVDLFGSSYDTKVYVYDENLNLIGCNDDFYPDYTSKLENLYLQGGVEYFVIVDGYGGDAGEYVLAVDEYEPCVIDCWDWAQQENEPPLVDDYVDEHNGGCNTDPQNPPFGTINDLVFCGTSGWYTYQGSSYRDTDWFEITMPAEGYIEVIGDAEFETYMFELGPQDCDQVAVIQNVIIGPCNEASMVIPGAPGSTVWFWVGPTTFDGPVNEYDYMLIFGCIYATESHSWTDVKALFD